MAESYDASSSNSDGLSMMTIPPSIDRSSIPEESYLAESKWWRLIKEGLIKKKKKTRSTKTENFIYFIISRPRLHYSFARVFRFPSKGEREEKVGK